MTLPAIFVERETISDVWEETILEIIRKGKIKFTEYGESSLCVNATLNILYPFKEPRIHRGDVYAYMSIKSGYVDEILKGTKDKYVKEGKEEYTYHDRIFSYKPPSLPPIDQINEFVVPKLKKSPFSRRAQAITWYVWGDPKSSSPPCLQRIWFTILDENLIMEANWRSRDAFRAMGANMYAMVELQKMVAEKLGKRIGNYIDKSSDLHIYEKSWEEVERFLKTLKRRRIEKKEKIEECLERLEKLI